MDISRKVAEEIAEGMRGRGVEFTEGDVATVAKMVESLGDDASFKSSAAFSSGCQAALIVMVKLLKDLTDTHPAVAHDRRVSEAQAEVAKLVGMVK